MLKALTFSVLQVCELAQLSPDLQTEVQNLCQLMMKSKSSEEYVTYKNSMQTLLGPGYQKNLFFLYFEEHWEGCKPEWVDYERDNLPHLSNHTNNRIENGWGKLKQKVDREYTIDELISTIVLLQEWSEDRYIQELKGIGTRQPSEAVDESDPELVALVVQLSPHAYRLVKDQYMFAKSPETMYTIDRNTAGVAILTIKDDEETGNHSVDTEVSHRIPHSYPR